MYAARPLPVEKQQAKRRENGVFFNSYRLLDFIRERGSALYVGMTYDPPIGPVQNEVAFPQKTVSGSCYDCLPAHSYHAGEFWRLKDLTRKNNKSALFHDFLFFINYS